VGGVGLQRVLRERTSCVDGTVHSARFGQSKDDVVACLVCYLEMDSGRGCDDHRRQRGLDEVDAQGPYEWYERCVNERARPGLRKRWTA
jgi:hypothetical protein